jgi:hypothetical protein
MLMFCDGFKAFFCGVGGRTLHNKFIAIDVMNEPSIDMEGGSKLSSRWTDELAYNVSL